MLYDVKPLDPVVFISAPVALALAALVATWIPARRATRVTPLTALKYRRGSLPFPLDSRGQERSISPVVPLASIELPFASAAQLPSLNSVAPFVAIRLPPAAKVMEGQRPAS